MSKRLKLSLPQSSIYAPVDRKYLIKHALSNWSVMLIIRHIFTSVSSLQFSSFWQFLWFNKHISFVGTINKWRRECMGGGNMRARWDDAARRDMTNCFNFWLLRAFVLNRRAFHSISTRRELLFGRIVIQGAACTFHPVFGAFHLSLALPREQGRKLIEMPLMVADVNSRTREGAAQREFVGKTKGATHVEISEFSASVCAVTCRDLCL